MTSTPIICEQLPHVELRLIDAGHFVWEDGAADYAALISAWWADGFKDADEDTSREPRCFLGPARWRVAKHVTTATPEEERLR